MRIAQVAPLYESVPPRLYGGTERVVFHLTEQLLREGHDVTLFASGDSETSAELVATRARAIRRDDGRPDALAAHFLMLDVLRRRAEEFDLIHFHTDLLHLPLFSDSSVPNLTTLHGRLDLDDLPAFYERFPDMPLVSISRSQQSQLPGANWLGTVHHGLPVEDYAFQERPNGGYLAFLGRISPEKRVDRAIRIARDVGIPLRIAAKVDQADYAYFRECIRPLLDTPEVEFIGEIGDADKPEFLGNALGLLFPVDWPEPFGLVMIEAMACGTPVIAWRNGAVPEVVEHGVSGFVVDSMAAAVRAAAGITDLDRTRVRDYCRRRFSVPRMSRDYLALYRRLVAPRGRFPVAL